MRYNPPPNWPSPPPGWEPIRDWKPDPSWPPAPPGWEFWVAEPSGLRSRSRRVATVLVRLVNPIRVGYGCAGLIGAVVFGWLFVALRFDAQWNYEGWLWRGVFPLLVMLVGLTAGVIGAIGVRRWDYGRWQQRGAADRHVPVR